MAPSTLKGFVGSMPLSLWEIARELCLKAFAVLWVLLETWSPQAAQGLAGSASPAAGLCCGNLSSILTKRT